MRAISYKRAWGAHKREQCGMCGFGPVDYAGCASLDTHHNQRLVASVWGLGFRG